MSLLQDKVALVTGGGRGIGRALALELAQAGCDVAVLARSTQELASVTAEVQKLGRRSIALTCDIADGAQVLQAHEQIVRTLGPIDIVINNAAIVQPMGPTATIDPEEWAQAMDINLSGTFRWISACLPTMLTRSWGRIITISSGVASGNGMQHANAYSVSKAGIEMLTANLTIELAGSGVTINTVRPGLVDTAMQSYIRELPPEQAGEKVHKQFTENHAKGILLSPTQPARLIVNLLAGETSGEIISIYDERGQELLAQHV